MTMGGAGARSWLDQALEKRARHNARLLTPFLVGSKILDVGAAEGWIGETIAGAESGRDVQLLDVIDMNRTGLPHSVYDGDRFPFDDRAFDTTLVMLCLHHCGCPNRVLDEAIRVTRRRLIVTESVYRLQPGRWLLWAMDTALNSVRSGGLMAEALNFRTVAQWQDAFADRRLILRRQFWISRGLHRHVAFILDPPP